MKKILFTSWAIIFIFLVSNNLEARPGTDKVKKNIIGTWKFHNLYNPYAPLKFNDKGENIGDTKITNDPRDLYTAFTFLENGKVHIWSLDRSKLDIGNQILNWCTYTKVDAKGAKFTVILITDADLKPDFDDKRLSQTPGLHYAIISNSHFLNWIKIERNEQYWKTSWQTVFEKIPDQPNY